MTQNDIESIIRTKDKILAVYPFLTRKEKDTFINLAEKEMSQAKEAKKTVRGLLELLNNPHAEIIEYKVYGKDFKKKFITEMSPSFRINDRVLFIKIPSWSTMLSGIDEKLKDYCFKNIEKYDGIIIDVRENQGGSSSIAHGFAGIFFKKSVIYGKFTRVGSKGNLKTSADKLNPDKNIYIEKPIVILISNRCFSSNELFLAPFKVSKRAILIGEPTRGGSANPVMEVIEPQKGAKFGARIPTYRFFLKGEKEPIEKTKIHPDIIYKKKDIEEFAKGYLKKEIIVKTGTKPL